MPLALASHRTSQRLASSKSTSDGRRLKLHATAVSCSPVLASGGTVHGTAEPERAAATFILLNTYMLYLSE